MRGIGWCFFCINEDVSALRQPCRDCIIYTRKNLSPTCFEPDPDYQGVVTIESQGDIYYKIPGREGLVKKG